MPNRLDLDANLVGLDSTASVWVVFHSAMLFGAEMVCPGGELTDLRRPRVPAWGSCGLSTPTAAELENKLYSDFLGA